jgi:hypothetical protein
VERANGLRREKKPRFGGGGVASTEAPTAAVPVDATVVGAAPAPAPRAGLTAVPAEFPVSCGGRTTRSSRTRATSSSGGFSTGRTFVAETPPVTPGPVEVVVAAGLTARAAPPPAGAVGAEVEEDEVEAGEAAPGVAGVLDATAGRGDDAGSAVLVPPTVARAVEPAPADGAEVEPAGAAAAAFRASAPRRSTLTVWTTALERGLEAAACGRVEAGAAATIAGAGESSRSSWAIAVRTSPPADGTSSR